jgi:hypothetical protein
MVYLDFLFFLPRKKEKKKDFLFFNNNAVVRIAPSINLCGEKKRAKP